MDIDATAPVAARDQIEVNADPDTVWAVISGIEHWPEWNPAVSSVALDGPLRPGTTFRWKAGGTITSTVIRALKAAAEQRAAAPAEEQR
jgi:uncharacterized membrane protein